MNPSKEIERIELRGNKSTSSRNLQRAILFFLVQKNGLDICFQCNKKINDISEFTIEHKIPYLHSEDPVGLFFDMDNIAFSHFTCNSKARVAIKPINHGTQHAYITRGCRCQICTSNWKAYRREYVAAWRELKKKEHEQTNREN